MSASTPVALPQAGCSTAEAAQAEALLFRFLREAPYFPGAGDLGIVTSAVAPWPHQLQVVRQCVERFPQSFLFCDEVGLGKTIEAGLALRQLLISGRVKRALLLVPKGVLRQWQEELHEKLALTVPRLEGDRFFDVHDREIEPASGNDKNDDKDDSNPWNRMPVLLASTQAAKRQQRREQLLAAEAWDLLIVDEAHHARRRGFSGASRRANRLLELLAGSPQSSLHGSAQQDHRGLVERCRCTYLLTATPMQVHPLEVWDLLRLLGLGGAWGSDEQAFIKYFQQLRLPPQRRDWPFLLTMLRDALRADTLAQPWQRLVARAPQLADLRNDSFAVGDLNDLNDLNESSKKVLETALRRCTPVQALTWRHTRRQLTAYRRQGRLDAILAQRDPANIWIDLTPEQGELYGRIEEYLSLFFQRYEAQRTGLGFVMTVYRRRLTSSFQAILRSLERRLAFLQGRAREPGSQTDSGPDSQPDTPAMSAAADQGHLFTGDPKRFGRSRDEVSYLQSFLDDLESLGEDPKLAQLRADLETVLVDHDRVLVFTQYADTLDFLRQALRHDYRVACYSGRGGELASDGNDNGEDEGGWLPCSKDLLKQRFGRGEIQVLLCTEAASEGLNFQTCGVLINFDMPWNPMRVEQRIGRIDRIGQSHERVSIRNYFYADTVEAKIYRRLADRIDWFQEVVGSLQPILHKVGETIQSLALKPSSQRPKALAEKLAGLRQTMEQRFADDGAILDATDDLSTDKPSAPLGPADIESILTGSQYLGPRLTPDDTLPGAWWLQIDDERHRVTFSPQVYEASPYELTLLTYGQPLFDNLLQDCPSPETTSDPTGLGLYRSWNPAPVSAFVSCKAGQVTAIERPTHLQATLTKGGYRPWTGNEEAEASSFVSTARKQVLRGMTRVEEGKRQDQRRALRTAARQLLTDSAGLELARAENPGLFDDAPEIAFGDDAVAALERHGEPFASLLAWLTDQPLPVIHPDHPAFRQWRGRPTASLDQDWSKLQQRGQQLREEWQSLESAEQNARQWVQGPSAGGFLERDFFPLSGEAEDESLELEPADVRPFENAVPLYDLDTIVATMIDQAQAPGQLQADEIKNPENYQWVQPTGRRQPTRGLFAAHVPHDLLAPRIPANTLALFQLQPKAPRPGDIVLLYHPGRPDPQTGQTYLLGQWQTQRRQPPTLVRPNGQPVTFDDFELDELTLIAQLVEIL